MLGIDSRDQMGGQLGKNVVTQVFGRFKFSLDLKVFGSDRSPRSQDVRACVRPCVCA